MPHPFIQGVYLSTSRDNGTSEPLVLHITDAISGTDRAIDVVDISSDLCSGWMTYVDFGIDPLTGLPLPINEIWVCVHENGETSDAAIAYDATTLEFKRRIVPTGSIGISIGRKIMYDKSVGKVLFVTSSSTTGDGYNYLDPDTLIWDGASTTDNTVDYYTGNVCYGENSIALSNFFNYATFFNGGEYVHKSVSTNNTPYIAYDSTRNRYAWWDRNASSKAVFRTVTDDTTWTVEDFSPTTTAEIAIFGSLDYFPSIDKYILSIDDALVQLNADTFETEQTWVFFSGSGSIYNCMEIAQMPEYLVAYTTVSPGLALVPLTDRLSSNSVLLSTIVTDICSRVDLAAGDIDVTQLTDDVAGYTIAQQMAARAALDGLQAAFYFDAVESD
jgi:hypothetical protein